VGEPQTHYASHPLVGTLGIPLVVYSGLKVRSRETEKRSGRSADIGLALSAQLPATPLPVPNPRFREQPSLVVCWKVVEMSNDLHSNPTLFTLSIQSGSVDRRPWRWREVGLGRELRCLNVGENRSMADPYSWPSVRGTNEEVIRPLRRSRELSSPVTTRETHGDGTRLRHST
jgi:hypothetical protein